MWLTLMKMWAQWSCVSAIEETMYHQVLVALSGMSNLVGSTRSITVAMFVCLHYITLLCVH